MHVHVNAQPVEDIHVCERARVQVNAEAAADLVPKPPKEQAVKQSRTVAILEHFESQMGRAHERGFSSAYPRPSTCPDPVGTSRPRRYAPSPSACLIAIAEHFEVGACMHGWWGGIRTWVGGWVGGWMDRRRDI